MMASSRHFIAGCPNCATKLKINRLYAGCEVMCKHCRETFLAPAGEPPHRPEPKRSRVIARP